MEPRNCPHYPPSCPFDVAQGRLPLQGGKEPHYENLQRDLRRTFETLGLAA